MGQGSSGYSLLAVNVENADCSQWFASLELSSLMSNVRLGARSWKTGGSSEMLLGLSILVGSQEKSV